MKEVNDHFFKRARREGYRSRAAYKLIEIDDRRRLIGKGDLVIDCGAAPGSWLQVASSRVGSRGRVLGIDLKVIAPHGLADNVTLIEGDTRTTDVLSILGSKADVVISDMAPDTTGTPSADQFRSARLCDELLDRLPLWLRKGGNCVMKVFEGEAYSDLLHRCGRMFEKAKGFKPSASRSESVEIFIICTGFKGSDPEVEQPDRALAPPRPSGWG